MHTTILTAISNPDILPFELTASRRAKNPVRFDKRTGKWVANGGYDPVTKRRRQKGGFRTKAEAMAWRRRLLAGDRKDPVGEKVAGMMPFQLIDAALAIEKMDAAGFRSAHCLLKAAEDYIARHPSSKPTTLAEFRDEWLMRMKGRCRPRTYNDARSATNPFVKKLGALTLPEIRLEDLEAVTGPLDGDAAARPAIAYCCALGLHQVHLNHVLTIFT